MHTAGQSVSSPRWILVSQDKEMNNWWCLDYLVQTVEFIFFLHLNQHATVAKYLNYIHPYKDEIWAIPLELIVEHWHVILVKEPRFGFISLSHDFFPWWMKSMKGNFYICCLVLYMDLILQENLSAKKKSLKCTESRVLKWVKFVNAYMKINI